MQLGITKSMVYLSTANCIVSVMTFLTNFFLKLKKTMLNQDFNLMSDESIDFIVEHEESKYEQAAAELEVTVDYYMMEFV